MKLLFHITVQTYGCKLYMLLIAAMTFKKVVKDLISQIKRTVDILGEDPTEITIKNVSIDKQKALKRDYIYNIEK